MACIFDWNTVWRNQKTITHSFPQKLKSVTVWTISFADMARNQICSPPQKQCKRLWCTSAEGDHKGCRTQHMPLADGTDCGNGMVSQSTCGSVWINEPIIGGLFFPPTLTCFMTLVALQLMFQACGFGGVGLALSPAAQLSCWKILLNSNRSFTHA